MFAFFQMKFFPDRGTLPAHGSREIEVAISTDRTAQFKGLVKGSTGAVHDVNIIVNGEYRSSQMISVLITSHAQ